MNHKASCGLLYPPLVLDCSTYQFRFTSFAELEFHNLARTPLSKVRTDYNNREIMTDKLWDWLNISFSAGYFN